MTEPPFRTGAIHTGAISTGSMPAGSTPTGHGDLASALAALEQGRTDTGCATRHRMSRPAKRAALTLAFVALLITGTINLATLTPGSRDSVDTGSRANIVFSNAQAGACLNWPPDDPTKPSFVQCRADHVFEVAKPLDAADSDDSCRLAVAGYLGTRYDPNSRFAISILGAGDADGVRVEDRNLLCGLQLLGPGGRPVAFKGSVAELDQSKVWPVGTCLGIDSSNQPTDVPTNCTEPHALEVTGSASLAERFPAEIPAEPDQRAFLEQQCTQAADAYLAPLMLATSGLALSYQPLSPESWAAGSRQVSCGIGRPGAQGWTPTTGNAKSLNPADVPAPIAPESTSEGPPPPVYQEPLIPIGPIPTGPIPTGPISTGPISTEVPPPAPVPAPSTSVATTPAPSPSPEAPPPAPLPSESPAPEPGVLQIPGLPPIYLPGYVPPAPPPPPPAPVGPLPGPPA